MVQTFSKDVFGRLQSGLPVYQWLTLGGKPSVFPLVKSSPEGDLANCYEGVFLHWVKNSSVIHHRCFLLVLGPFGALELTGVCFLIKNVTGWFILI